MSTTKQTKPKSTKSATKSASKPAGSQKAKSCKKSLNAQDAKTLARLLSTYGASVILSEIGRKESKDLEHKLSELTKAKLEEAKPALEKFVAGAETLIKTKVLKHIEDFRKSINTEQAPKSAKPGTKKS